MITHNLGVVRETSDHVFVMYAGMVVEQGADALRCSRTPRHPYTRALMACVPKLSGAQAMRGIDGACPITRRRRPAAASRRAARSPSTACANPPPHIEVSPGHTAACWRLEATA